LGDQVIVDILVADTVTKGEQPVSEAGHLLGAGCELLDGDLCLAGDSVVGGLHQKIVGVLEDCACVGADLADVECIVDVEEGHEDLIEEIHSLLRLAETSRIGVISCYLASESPSCNKLER
jgi:hypothetical protein